ncbi:FkbM family methyltransferase [Crenalkalicoccus roseus]|uniref:FkbM family methyltransferase n=1 Tax=Crenalkalicoccus roseus TaxID=1485588 RepID=UPI0010813887|nr:FkbM family methyltransferase [Crenalkalicoccus roseus]
MPPDSPDPAAAALPRPAAWRARLAGFGERRLPLLPLRRLREPGPEAEVQAAVRALATALPMAGGTLLCRALGRYKMLLDAGDAALAPHLALDGFWKWWVTAFLARNIRPGETVVDGGAAYGYFTLLAADLVGPTGRVVAVEPHPRLATLLPRNLRLNGFEGRTERHQAALVGPGGAGRALFAVPPDAPAGGRVVAEEAAGEATQEVPATTLDALLPGGADLVRLDLNGGEEAAWAGMQGMLAARPGLRLLLGFDPARCRAPAAWLEALARRFPLRRLDHDGIARPCEAAALLAGGEATLYLAREAPR